MALHSLDKTVLNLSSGIIFVMKNAEFRMPSFAVQVEFSLFVFIEFHSPVDKCFDLCRSLPYNFFYGSTVTYPVTGNHCVFNMLIEIVYQEIRNGGHSPLCKISVCLFQTALTDKGYFSFVCHFQSKAHSGNTGTNDEEIELFNHNLNVYYRKTTK